MDRWGYFTDLSNRGKEETAWVEIKDEIAKKQFQLIKYFPSHPVLKLVEFTEDLNLVYDYDQLMRALKDYKRILPNDDRGLPTSLSHFVGLVEYSSLLTDLSPYKSSESYLSFLSWKFRQ